MPTTSNFEWHVYVLELEDGYWYVGISTSVGRRFMEHCDRSPKRFKRKYPPFTLLHMPINIVEDIPLGTCVDKEAAKFEKRKTVEVAAKYGYEFVAGGGYKAGGSRLRRAVESYLRQLP